MADPVPSPGRAGAPRSGAEGLVFPAGSSGAGSSWPQQGLCAGVGPSGRWLSSAAGPGGLTAGGSCPCVCWRCCLCACVWQGYGWGARVQWGHDHRAWLPCHRCCSVQLREWPNYQCMGQWGPAEATGPVGPGMPVASGRWALATPCCLLPRSIRQIFQHGSAFQPQARRSACPAAPSSSGQLPWPEPSAPSSCTAGQMLAHTHTLSCTCSPTHTLTLTLLLPTPCCIFS